MCLLCLDDGAPVFPACHQPRQLPLKAEGGCAQTSLRTNGAGGLWNLGGSAGGTEAAKLLNRLLSRTYCSSNQGLALNALNLRRNPLVPNDAGRLNGALPNCRASSGRGA